MIELTIDQAKKHPFNFVYIWASDEYLSRINPKYAAVIRTKRANQNKLIYLSAEKFNTTEKAYTDAIRSQFIKDFGITPAEALVQLAQGKTVAGKNYAEGIYGVGSLSSSFKNTNVTVDKQTGYIEVNGKMVNDTDQIYNTQKGSETGLYQHVYLDKTTGMTYVSQYNKITKKWYAQSYSDSDGVMYKPNGNEMKNIDASTVWETTELSFDFFQKIINWILSLFGVNSGSDKETLNSENTLPNQQKDGYTYTTGFGEAGMIALALVAGGAILMAPGKKIGKKK